LLLAVGTYAQTLPVNTPYCEACSASDLIFIIDASQSIPDANYQAELTFIENILSSSRQNGTGSWGYLIGSTVQVGVMIFENFVVSQLPFSQANDYNTVYAYLEARRSLKTGGTSNLCTPLQKAGNEFAAYGRVGVPKTLVVFTDGDPNSRTGSCTPSVAIQYANQMKANSSISAEIICVAVAGTDGYQPASNYPVLNQMASTENGSPVVYSLTDPNALMAAEDSIASRMSCCSCYPDLSYTVELGDALSGSDATFINNMFNNILGVVGYWFTQNSKWNIKAGAALVTYSDGGANSAVRIVSSTTSSSLGSTALCTDISCWQSAIGAGCKEAISNNGDDGCLWNDGYSDIPAGLSQTMGLENIYRFGSASAPNVNVMSITGHCDALQFSNDCNNLPTSATTYQKGYELRIGEELNINGFSNDSNFRLVLGSTPWLVKGPGYPNMPKPYNNIDCIIYNIQRALYEVPGCAAQPYINDDSVKQNTCQSL